MRKRVSICFSGHPRSFLDHESAWNEYFNVIQEEFDLSVYFHSWADAGLLQKSSDGFTEGALEPGRYNRLQELVSYLRPAAYAIESVSTELQRRVQSMRPVILSSWQGGRNSIMSQLYSIHKADLLRRAFEEKNGAQSNVVVRMRFDAPPHLPVINDLRFVAQNPKLDVLIAPSPAWHVHPGGGGGCVVCQAFYVAHQGQAALTDKVNSFLKEHRHHTNDICDLFAVGSPKVMERYTDIFNQADVLFSKVIAETPRNIMDGLTLTPDTDCSDDRRITATVETAWDIEVAPVFVPERLVRLQMAGVLVLHGETIVVIRRR